MSKAGGLKKAIKGLNLSGMANQAFQEGASKYKKEDLTSGMSKDPELLKLK